MMTEAEELKIRFKEPYIIEELERWEKGYNMPAKRMLTRHVGLLDNFPNIDISGSLKGMKKLFWGKSALVVRCGGYYYKVTGEVYFGRFTY